jgi:hypothetical protein
MTRKRLRAFGPVLTMTNAETVRADLVSQGVTRRSIAVVPLAKTDSIEQQPFARWVITKAALEAVWAMTKSIPLMAAGYIALYAILLDHSIDLTLGVGIVSALGATPIVGIIAFTVNWGRWAPLTAFDDTRRPDAGYMVVTIDPGEMSDDPRADRPIKAII